CGFGVRTSPMDRGTDQSMRINEDVRKSVIFIGVLRPDGSFIPYGTGFLVLWFEEGKGFPYLVTAKHVVEDAKHSGLPVVGRVNTRLGPAHVGTLVEEAWQYHTTNKKSDVAVALSRLSFETFDIKHVGLNDGCLSEKYVKDNDVGCGDEVFVTGLLTRHYGKTRNIPIVRMGNIAGMPDELVDLGSGPIKFLAG
ncbi:MAG TPA: hypothetical protein VNO50_07430, partial [Pyrinomonadaceae bacterium]|nr:hypothetical protein [Pyrinomonadaceae bacterium]